MHQGYLVWTVLVLALPHTTLSVPSRLQLQLHRGQFPDVEDLDEGKVLRSRELAEAGREVLTQSESVDCLRTALRALLDLDDRDLNAIVDGVPLHDDKPSMSPSSALFLHASGNRLQELQRLISNEGDKTYNPHKTKKASSAFLSEALERNLEERNFETSAGSDSLLEALTELSASLDKKSQLKNRRREPKYQKHKRHTYHSSRQETHYSYWLRSGKCPKSADGLNQVYCPSPTASGEWVCVDSQDLCDGHSHCPGSEDEDPKACLFYKSIHNYLDFLTAAVLSTVRRY